MEALSAATAVPGRRSRASSGLAFLAAFGVVAVGVGMGRAITTSFLPVLLDSISHAPALIGAVMIVNAVAGFAVPLAVGLWSDRRRGGPLQRRLPFIVGGTAVSVGGLVAVALGTATSYLVLGAAALFIYVGLNATATAHRTLVVEGFADGERPAATSAQEVAMLIGGLAGILVGGALIDGASWLPFAIAAALMPVLALPTLLSARRRFADGGSGASDEHEQAPHPRDFVRAMRRRGAREVLAAQVLWVMAYAALPAFFVLYAEDVLGVGAGTASLYLAGFGLFTGAGMLIAGRARPGRVYPLVCLGAALLGGGLATGALLDRAELLVVPMAAAALGFGLVTALGFPLFARYVPEGQSGRYSGLYFSTRAIASTIALPLAGGMIQLTGSYRLLLAQGAAGLLALVPLARLRRRDDAVAAAPGEAVERLAAVIPCFAGHPVEPVVRGVLPHVERVVLVDDGSLPPDAEAIERAADRANVEVIRLAANSGKGTAVAAGVRAALEASPPPEAVVVLDADGQHPPEAIPAFAAAAAHADVVVGNRRGQLAGMPVARRFTNLASSALLGLVTRRRLPDTQCGMRLYRVEALSEVPLPNGRYEAETRHLKAALARGQRVAWVPIPAIYNGSASAFRNLRDTARVLAAILRPAGAEARRAAGPHWRRPSREFARIWSVRLGLLIALTMVLGALVPVLAPMDHRLFLAVNSLGSGPGWVYDALDPHTRNYVVISLAIVAGAIVLRPRWGIGAATAVLIAAFASDLLLQSVYLLYDRPRPEEALAGQVMVTHDRSWAHIASFPSGHLAVTTAIATAGALLVPALRWPLAGYVAAIALTRITFGAHFPLDVFAGAIFGLEIGYFSVATVRAMDMLPAEAAAAVPLRARLERALQRAGPGGPD